jgi:uncharacterized Tic20 family protein
MESNTTPPDGDTPVTGAVGPSKEERTMAMICHLLPFAGCLLPHIPVFNVVAPLVLWLIKKDSMPFLNEQGKEVLNFQITVSLILFACFITFWLLIPIAIAFVVAIGTIVLMIIAAIQVNEGKPYRYPFTLRLIK